MKLLQKLSFATMALAMLFASCSTDGGVITKQATVAISDATMVSSTSVSAVFTPDANCTWYEYAIGTSDDRASFLAGELEGILSATEGQEVVFENLDGDTTYTIYARGYDSSETAGSLASITVRCYSAECELETLFVGTTSVGFAFTPSSSVYRVDYAFDTPGQADEFDSGDLNNIKSLTEESYKAINIFDLEEDTEYSLYYKYYDRLGNISDTVEVSVTTSNTATSPGISLELGDINIICGYYTFVPNANCSKYSFLVGADDQYSEIYDSTGWGGDIYSMIISWADFEEDDWGVYSKTEDHEFMLYSLDLYSSTDMEFLVVTYDADGNPFSLESFEFSTPVYEATGEALIDKIEEIYVDSYSASFTITPNENVFATFYAVFTQYAWDNYYSYDDCLEDLQYLFLDDYTDGEAVLNIGNEPFTYEEDSTLTPNTTYYVVAIPLDGTGIDTDTGWGTAKTYEFTTGAM
ncbi:MAG: hypothetical protein SNG57_05370 [Rikenellaceae bacterium]